jgi:hypothetical protein
VISGQSELAAAPDDADEILLSDGGVLKRLGIDNLMTHPAIPKAYGVVDFSSGTPTAIAGAYGCSFSAGDATSATIDLSTDMGSTDYAVLVTQYGSATNSNGANYVVQIVDAGQFKIHYSSDVDVAFTVLGAH